MFQGALRPGLQAFFLLKFLMLQKLSNFPLNDIEICKNKKYITKNIF